MPFLFHEPVREKLPPCPLIIYLHGRGEVLKKSNVGSAYFLIDGLVGLEKADAAKSAYMAMPAGEFSPEEVNALVKSLCGQYANIDQNRIYIIGYSDGARALCEAIYWKPTLYAAAVPICGALMSDPAVVKNIPTWVMQGGLDHPINVECARAYYEIMLEVGSTVCKYTEDPKWGHDFHTETFKNQDLYTWLFAQHK